MDYVFTFQIATFRHCYSQLFSTIYWNICIRTFESVYQSQEVWWNNHFSDREVNRKPPSAWFPVKFHESRLRRVSSWGFDFTPQGPALISLFWRKALKASIRKHKIWNTKNSKSHRCEKHCCQLCSLNSKHKNDEKGKKRRPDNRTAFSIDIRPTKIGRNLLACPSSKKCGMNGEREEQKWIGQVKRCIVSLVGVSGWEVSARICFDVPNQRK